MRNCRAVIGLLLLVAVSGGLAAPILRTSAANVGDLLKTPADNSPESRWIDRWWTSPPDLAAIVVDNVSRMSSDQINNAHLVDLRDVDLEGEFRLVSSRKIIERTEAWEQGAYSGAGEPGYPTVVRNVEGRNADGRYYLYYAIHDPYSGIGCAIAERLDGSFIKLAQLDPSRPDSRVLRAPRRPRKTSHFSSPVVTWNPQEKLWFMYFHYYSNELKHGKGHQRTTVAVTDDLSSHNWKIWADAEARYIAVLPTTRARWMNSQSTYHSISRLGDELWFAFLRGTGGEYREAASGQKAFQQFKTQLGFALSRDGRRWAQYEGNPYLHQHDGRGGSQGNYRPAWIGFNETRLLLAWSEADLADHKLEPVFGKTRDLTSIEPLDLKLKWPVHDGAVAVWREDRRLHLFSGGFQHVVRLPPVERSPQSASPSL